METKDPNLVKEPIDNQATNNKELEGSIKREGATELETLTNKGTETLKNDDIHSEHVNKGDNPARQPDRRDQKGETPFDGNVNDKTMPKAADQVHSDEITDENKYANIDNAQQRVLNDDLK